MNKTSITSLKTKPHFKPGDPVVLVAWGPRVRSPSRAIKYCKYREYGRVIDMYWHKKLETWDVYVAFFGTRWPTDRTLAKNKPYILRYLESSLTPYDVEQP